MNIAVERRELSNVNIILKFRSVGENGRGLTASSTGNLHAEISLPKKKKMDVKVVNFVRFVILHVSGVIELALFVSNLMISVSPLGEGCCT